MKAVLLVLVALLCAAVGALLATRRPAPKEPDPAAIIQRVREAARLETLDVTLYKKVDFAPEPQPAGSTWSALTQWARHTVRPPHGKAIVFAEAHLSIDLRKLDERALRVQGHKAWAVLPKVEAAVELKPGETEVLGSNLDSAETALLLQAAKESFQRAVESDAALQEKARESARRALRALFAQAGVLELEFVAELPRSPSL